MGPQVLGSQGSLGKLIVSSIEQSAQECLHNLKLSLSSFCDWLSYFNFHSFTPTASSTFFAYLFPTPHALQLGHVCTSFAHCLLLSLFVLLIHSQNTHTHTHRCAYAYTNNFFIANTHSFARLHTYPFLAFAPLPQPLHSGLMHMHCLLILPYVRSLRLLCSSHLFSILCLNSSFILCTLFLNLFALCRGTLGLIVSGIAILWCAISASKLFATAFSMDHQQLLIAYPCAVLYGGFALITIYQGEPLCTALPPLPPPSLHPLFQATSGNMLSAVYVYLRLDLCVCVCAGSCSCCAILLHGFNCPAHTDTHTHTYHNIHMTIF